MTEFLSYAFVQRAIVTGLLLSTLAGYYGVFVVQRRQSFLGAGLGHAAFGGIALGLFLGMEPLSIAVPFTVLVAAGIHYVRAHTDLAADTAIGVFFSVAVALGVLFLALRPDSAPDAFSYLFGSILAVSRIDLLSSAALAALGAASAAPWWGRWAYATFDAEAARADGIPVERDSLVLTLLVALTIVLSVKIVGILLVAAWIVIPAASARMASGSFASMTMLSIGLSITSTVAGLLASFVADIPTGAAIVLMQALIFGLIAAFGRRST